MGIREGVSREALSSEEELTSEVPVVGQEKGTPGRRTSRCQGPEVEGVWYNLGTEIGGGTVEHGRKQAGRQIRSHKGYGKPAGSEALCIQEFGVRVIWSVGKITNSVSNRAQGEVPSGQSGCLREEHLQGGGRCWQDSWSLRAARLPHPWVRGYTSAPPPTWSPGGSRALASCHPWIPMARVVTMPGLLFVQPSISRL